MKPNTRFPVSALQAALPLLCLAILHCTIRKPVTPSWDAFFELPLIDSTFTVASLVEDADRVSVRGNEVAVDINETPDAFRVGEYLTTGMTWNENLLSFGGVGTTGARQSISDTLILEDTILIESAVFDSGDVNVELDNQTGFFIGLRAEVPSLRNPDGSMVVFDRSGLPPGFSRLTIPLENISFRPGIGGSRNLIPYDGFIELQSPAGVQGHSVRVRIDLSKVKYKSVTGWLNRTSASVDETVETDLEVSDAFEGVQFASALLNLTLFNPVGFPGSLDVVITGESRDGRTASVPVRAAVAASAATEIGPMDVAPLVNLMPETLRIRGTLYMGDGLTKATITRNDSVSAAIRIHAPLVFSLPAKTNDTDPDTIEMEKDGREFVRGNLGEAFLILDLLNHIPIGASASFYFSGTRGGDDLYVHPDIVKTAALTKPQTAPASGTALNPGLVTSPALSTIAIGLDSTEVKVFDHPEVYWGMRLEFPGTGGMVQVRADDWIRVQCRIRALVTVDFEEEEEEGENGEGGGS
ncbi:MAG: hypothetical protein QUS35_03810 [bacterium]|nr:hypothetical protein [bacterium]